MAQAVPEHHFYMFCFLFPLSSPLGEALWDSRVPPLTELHSGKGALGVLAHKAASSGFALQNEPGLTEEIISMVLPWAAGSTKAGAACGVWSPQNCCRSHRL